MNISSKAKHYKNIVGNLAPQQQEVKSELKVNYNNTILPLCSEPKYLGERWTGRLFAGPAWVMEQQRCE